MKVSRSKAVAFLIASHGAVMNNGRHTANLPIPCTINNHAPTSHFTSRNIFSSRAVSFRIMATRKRRESSIYINILHTRSGVTMLLNIRLDSPMPWIRIWSSIRCMHVAAREKPNRTLPKQTRNGISAIFRMLLLSDRAPKLAWKDLSTL